MFMLQVSYPHAMRRGEFVTGCEGIPVLVESPLHLLAQMLGPNCVV